jgi:hypothetical protein
MLYKSCYEAPAYIDVKPENVSERGGGGGRSFGVVEVFIQAADRIAVSVRGSVICT